MRPLEDEEAEEEGCENEDKFLLATLTSHQLGVNCVRWSKSGEMLASGGDDAVIMLWTLEAGTTTVFGQENVENWSPLIMLRGHTGEVTGLAWSPDGSLVDLIGDFFPPF